MWPEIEAYQIAADAHENDLEGGVPGESLVLADDFPDFAPLGLTAFEVDTLNDLKKWPQEYGEYPTSEGREDAMKALINAGVIKIVKMLSIDSSGSVQ